MSPSLRGRVSHFRVSRLLSLVFCRTLQYHKGSTDSTVTRLVFPTAAESPSSPGEDLAGSPGCDRHTAVQRRLDIMEEVRGARAEGIVMFRGHLPGWKLCGVQMSENPGQSCSPAARLVTPRSHWDVQLGNVFYNLPPRRHCLCTARDSSSVVCTGWFCASA